jgi:beta-phosphoglucomutase-like phosphatase (HAD superfamily)
VRTLIVAVDGVLADTLPMRAAALRAAARELGVAIAQPIHEQWIAGRDWADAARALVRPAEPLDETMIDLLALAAERALHARLGQGAPLLFPALLSRCAEAASQGWRVILRTDSSRRAAGAVLDHLMHETTAWRAVTADEVRSASAGVPLLLRQYAHIAPLVRAAPRCSAIEVSPEAFAVARDEVPGVRAGWPLP